MVNASMVPRLSPPSSLIALEFKHAISELDEEVSELAQQSQHLERFTIDSISMEVSLRAGLVDAQSAV
jgi:hypothetical protein